MKNKIIISSSKEEVTINFSQKIVDEIYNFGFGHTQVKKQALPKNLKEVIDYLENSWEIYDDVLYFSITPYQISLVGKTAICSVDAVLNRFLSFTKGDVILHIGQNMDQTKKSAENDPRFTIINDIDLYGSEDDSYDDLEDQKKID